MKLISTIRPKIHVPPRLKDSATGRILSKEVLALKIVSRILSKIPPPQKLKDGASVTSKSTTLQKDRYGAWSELANLNIRESIDPYSNRLKPDFLRQPSISGTIHVNARVVGVRIGRYLAATDYGSKLLSLYSDSLFGRPYLIQPDFPCLSSISMQHLSFLEHLYRYLDIDLINSGKDFQFIEFGGGYGNLTRILLQINDKVKVEIIDIPSMLQIQELFLKTTVAGSMRHQRVRFLQSQRDVYELVSERTQGSHKHFQATYSLDETPIEVRNDVENTILVNSDSFFVAYGPENSALNIDNRDWAQGFQDRVTRKFSVRSGPLPGDWRSFFICGRRIQD